MHFFDPFHLILFNNWDIKIGQIPEVFHRNHSWRNAESMPGWKLSFDGAHDGWSCAKFPGNDISCNTLHLRYIKNRKAWSNKNPNKKGLPVHCPSNSGRFQGTQTSLFRCFHGCFRLRQGNLFSGASEVSVDLITEAVYFRSKGIPSKEWRGKRLFLWFLGV